MASPNFRAIIVGGGPVGLIAAHIFTKAELDFVVLEKGSTVYPDLGASLALWPQTFRTLDQLDLLDVFNAIKSELGHRTVLTKDGKAYRESNSFDYVQSMHGYSPSMFHRRDLLKAFYDSLTPESKTKILTGKRVTSIESNAAGVVVRCDDGTVESGSIVIGADGAHSKTRQLMRDLALARSLKATVNAEKPYKTTYRVMFGNAPIPDQIHSGEIFESHGQDTSSQLFVGNERMWFFIYQRLATPKDKATSYTEKDMMEYAEQLGDLHLTEGLSLREVFATRNNAGLTDLEEGVVEHWAWDRIVLVGDAAHKVTPNLGWGFNSGVQDLISLSNELRRLVHQNQEGASLQTKDFEVVFTEYQKQRMEVMTKVTDISGQITRSSTWTNSISYFLDRYFFSWVDFERLLSRFVMAPIVSQSLVLDFLRESHFRQGQVPWINKPRV
jgi:2-polyprenyl-6-methoxyphenol hydroxylase-like FAD-dependent oxidoreductase